MKSWQVKKKVAHNNVRLTYNDKIPRIIMNALLLNYDFMDALLRIF